MQEYGEHCSTSERRADLATRDAVDWLKCEYMLSRQGQICKGIISDVTSFGVFVELNDIYIQGLLHITALKNDYYRYEASNYLLQGRQTGHTYRLGDPIEVLVARVDLDKRTIDFELPAQASDKPAGRHKKKRRKR
jgi:ribonuclease R